MKKFYISQKVFTIGDKYDVFDKDENVCYHAKGEIFTLGAKIHVFQGRNSKELFLIKRRLFTFFPHYDMYKDGVLVASIKKNFTFFSHSITVKSDYGNYEIEGDFISHDFVIKKDGKIVSSIHKKWLSWGDTYEIVINEDKNSDFYVSLVIMIDNVIHGSSSKDD